MKQISAIIITFNEEKNIERCIVSLLPVVDEIIVIDSYSTDKTKEICLRHEVRFIPMAWQGYAQTKNAGNDLASHPYILSIDADECLSEALQEELLHLKQQPLQGAYKIKRLTNYCGHWIKHCGWYPDTKLRLFPKNLGQWAGILHEEVVFERAIQTTTLTNDLWHYSFHSKRDHLRQIEKYTSILAQEMANKKSYIAYTQSYTSAFARFIRDYFIKLGFLDGLTGFTICRLSAYATFLKYKKAKALIADERH